MAWQQQWANAATPSMVPALSGMSAVVNPAPAVLPPGAQYTADQWTQMQHQNWQQWAQWQQQYQQWHQQYGAQYQKSMTALSQTPTQPTHSLPNTSLPPPLPQESKPPLPPEEPPAQVLQPQQPTKGYTTVPPPQQGTIPQHGNIPQQGNFTTAPPKQNVYTPPSSQSPYNTQPPNKQSPYKTPSQQSYNAAHSSSFQGRNAGGPPHQNQKRNFGYNAPNWQASTNERNFTANQNAPPSLLDLNVQKPDINSTLHGEKRPFVQTEDQDIKRNKIDEKLQSQCESPSIKNTVTNPQSDVDPKEQLSETEKKFMKQFIEWEAQFNKWKDQNMNHPDKEQYREYEKKWEAWRTQLLERREQMRRKRLGLQGDSPVPDGKNVPIVKPGIKQPVANSENVQVVSDVSKLPPTTNTELIDINKPPPVINDTSDELKDDGSSFLKMTSSEGIPGLDLVKESMDGNMTEDMNAINTTKENKGPDFDALSKGINNILGDQKLLNMLSLVTKNQTPQSSSTSIDTPKVLESLQTESGDNPSPESINLQTRIDAMGNYDEQTRSSFAGPVDVNWNTPRKGSDMNQENFNRYNQGDTQVNFNSDLNIGNNFNKRQPIFDMDYDPLNRYGRSDNIKNQDNFYGNSFRRPDSFTGAAADPDNENLRGPGNNNSFNNFRGPDSFRGPGSFKGRDMYAGPDKFMGSDVSKLSFRKPDNFRGSDHFQGNDNFRATDKFWESGNFRASDNYTGPKKEYDDYGAEDEFEESDNIAASENFTTSSNFKKTDNFKTSETLMPLRFEPPEKFEDADDNFGDFNNSWRRDKFRGNDAFRGADNFREPGGFRETDNINQPARGPNNFRAPNNLRESDTVGGPDSFRAPGNLRGSDNFEFNEPDNVKEPDNFRGSGEFRGPNDFRSFRGSNNSRGSGNFGGAKSFGRPENFNDNDRIGGPGALEDFREYGNARESNNFEGPDNYRTFGKFNRSGGFRGSENNRNFQDSDNFDDFGGNSDNFNMGEQRFNSGNLKRDNRGNDKFNRGNRNRSLSDWTADDSKEGNWYNENCDEERGNKNMEIDFSGGSQLLMKEADKFTQGAGHNVDEAHNIKIASESKNEEQWGTEEHNTLTSVSSQVAMGEDSNAKEVPEVIWQPESVIDYEHKTQKPVEPDITLEPLKLFDYRHKPVNRIPLPHRPNWLSNILRNCPEFDFMTSQPYDNQYNRYNKENRFTESRYDTRYSENKYPEYNKYQETKYAENKYPENKYPDNKYPDNKYPENKYPENKYPENKYQENKYPENKHTENKYTENKCPENKHPDNKYSENKYDNRYNDRNKFESRRNLRNNTYKEEDVTSNFQKRFDDYRPSFNRRPRDDTEYETNQFERKIDKRNVEDEDEAFPKRPCNVNLKDRQFKELEKSTTENKSRTPSKIALIEDILNPPGRFSRPARIVIILRGPPGSGKTFLAKLIKDKEVENGGSAPRILSLEDYFMVEQEKDVVEDGKKTKVKEMVYEYEECMEVSYRTSLLKAFKKTITDGYFPFIIVDNVNDKIKYFGEMWSFAKQNGFQVYICQLELDVQTCTKRNIHGRSEIEIQRLVAGWEPAPSHHSILDATGLVQSGSIPDVEMEEINSPTSDMGDESVEEQACRSKWDNFDCSIDNLAKLDGINKPLRPSKTMEDYLHCDDDWVSRESTKPGQKRVRWADLEERKEQEKMRAIGFVVGQTNWDRMMDPTMGSSALTQTKYIERASKFYRD